MTKTLNSVLLVSAKTKIVGGTITNPGQTRVSRFMGRLVACERRDQQHYDNGVISLSSNLAAARMFFCIVLVSKVQIGCFDVPKAYSHGILPTVDTEPSCFMRLPSQYPVLGRQTVDENGRPLVFEITGNLYGLIRAGNTWWEYLKNWLLNDMNFDQSVINPCVFHQYWDEPYWCPVLQIIYPAGQQGHIG